MAVGAGRQPITLKLAEKNRAVYHFPNDAAENERLDLQHHIWYLTLDGKLGLAPPHNPDAKVGRVLDLGTGTGIWAMDFADEHPEAEAGSPL